MSWLDTTRRRPNTHSAVIPAEARRRLDQQAIAQHPDGGVAGMRARNAAIQAARDTEKTAITERIDPSTQVRPGEVPASNRDDFHHEGVA